MGTVRYQKIEQNGKLLVEEIHKVVVHSFRMGDVDDPDIYAADPIYQWQQTEQGQFVMEHAIKKPEWHRNLDHYSMGWHYIILAEIESKKLSEMYLRWGNPNGNN